jgi:nucleotide-binding universal stress UspA family protein
MTHQPPTPDRETAMQILIAYDGSEGANDIARDLARAGLPDDARATVLAVSPREEDGAEELAREGAEALRARFPGWHVEGTGEAGDPAEVILAAADRLGADLVVMGAHGKGGFKRWLLGGVSHRVVRRSHRTVRIARPRESEGGADRPVRLVLGVDGSPDARAAVDALATRHWPDGTRVLIAMFEPLLAETGAVPHPLWGGEAIDLNPNPPDHDVERRIVDSAAQSLKRRMPSLAVSTLVRAGLPAYGLMELAERWSERGADCIFLGASGVRGIERFALGSVSATVASYARCSVEIVRPRDGAD